MLKMTFERRELSNSSVAFGYGDKTLSGTVTRRAKSYGTVTVLGAGAWGTALALAFARAGAHVRLWGRNATHIRRMEKTRRNDAYLPEIPLPRRIRPMADVIEAVSGSDAVFFAVPTTSVRDLANRVSDAVAPGTPVVSCAKGIDPDGHCLMTDCLADELPECAVMVLSGPSFAAEVADEHPTGVMLAGKSDQTAALAQALSSPTFHIEPTPDLIGVQVGGAMKNVIAIACGIADGLGFGANTRAAVLARGLEEAAAFCSALEGQPETLLGVAGVGDLALTCTDPQSRNYSFGLALGNPDTDIQGKTFEGADNVARICRLAERLEIDAPISQAVSAVLSHDLAPADMVSVLFSLDQKTALTALTA